MECQHCNSTNNLLCSSCFKYKEHLQLIYQKEKHVATLRVEAEDRLIKYNIEAKTKNQREGNEERVRRLRKKIAELKAKIKKENKKTENMKVIHDYVMEAKIPLPSEAEAIFLKNLAKKNELLYSKLLSYRSYFKQVLCALLNCNQIEEKKYKLQRYFKIEESNEMIFIEEIASFGIPVLKGYKEEVVVYDRLEDRSEERAEEIDVGMSIKIGIKIMVLIWKVFLEDFYLPYRVFYKNECFYMGDLLLKFNERIDISSSKMIEAINMLQSNIQYICYVTGYGDRPVFMLGKHFLDFYEASGFQNGCKKGQAQRRGAVRYLKYLKVNEKKEELGESDTATELVLPTEDFVLEFKKSSGMSDDEFELLA